MEEALQEGLEDRPEVVEEEQGQCQVEEVEGELLRQVEEEVVEVAPRPLPPLSSPRRPRGGRRSRYHR